MDSMQEWNNDRELRRTISGPISAKIKTMNNSSFLVFSEANHEEDSDEEDLDRYTDVGLREQLFITLSRAIRSTQNTDTKITESAIPDSIKNKRAQRRKLLNTNQQQTITSQTVQHKSPKQAPLRLPKHSISNITDSHQLEHNNDLQYDQGNGLKQNIKKHRRQRSNIREYSPRKTKENALHSKKPPNITIDSQSMPLSSINAFTIDDSQTIIFPKHHKSDKDMISSLERTRKHKSDKILSNLPKSSQTPKIYPHHHHIPPPPIHHKSVCIINTKTKKKIYKNIPPPPKSPPPQNPKIIKNDIYSHLNGKQRQFRHSEWKQSGLSNNLSPRQSEKQNIAQFGSYNGPSFGALSIETQSDVFEVYKPPKPSKKAPILRSQTPKIQKQHQLFTPYKSNKYKPARNRTRSRSKDDAELKIKSVQKMKKINEFDLIYPTSPKHKKLPPSPTKLNNSRSYAQNIKNGNALMPNRRIHAASISPKSKSHMIIPNQPTTPTSPAQQEPVKYFGKMRNETKYNTLGPEIFAKMNEMHEQKKKYSADDVQNGHSHKNIKQFQPKYSKKYVHTTIVYI